MLIEGSNSHGTRPYLFSRLIIKGNTSLLKALKDITSQQYVTALLQAIDDLTGVKERTTMMRSLSKVTSRQKKD
jgi:hypothetical protein